MLLRLEALRGLAVARSPLRLELRLHCGLSCINSGLQTSEFGKSGCALWCYMPRPFALDNPWDLPSGTLTTSSRGSAAWYDTPCQSWHDSAGTGSSVNPVRCRLHALDSRPWCASWRMCMNHFSTAPVGWVYGFVRFHCQSTAKFCVALFFLVAPAPWAPQLPTIPAAVVRASGTWNPWTGPG